MSGQHRAERPWRAALRLEPRAASMLLGAIAVTLLCGAMSGGLYLHLNEPTHSQH